MRMNLERVEEALVRQRVLGHGEGQEHAIADVNAGRVNDLIRPLLLDLESQLVALQLRNDALQESINNCAQRVLQLSVARQEFR